MQRGFASIRNQNFPTRVRKTTKEALEKAATGPDGLIRCQNPGCPAIIEPGKGSPQHIPDLAHQWNNGLNNVNQEIRNEAFNETAKELHCLPCQKSEGGRSENVYTSETGPNYVPRSKRIR